MKVAIVGSRTFSDFTFVEDTLDKYFPDCATIISGGAQGADQLAKQYADAVGIDFILYKPYHLIDNSVEFHPRFFHARNKQIVDNADVVAIFTDGHDDVADNFVKLCEKRRREYRVYNVAEVEQAA